MTLVGVFTFHDNDTILFSTNFVAQINIREKNICIVDTVPTSFLVTAIIVVGPTQSSTSSIYLENSEVEKLEQHQT